MLVARFFHLDEGDPDKLIWTKNAVNGDFSSKKGYEEAIMDQFDKDKCWWWNKLWENNIPLKTILTFWLAMNNRLLTWENMRKQGFQGHSLCVLCKSNEEHSSHLFNYCPDVGDVWTTATKTFTQDAQIINTDINLEQRAHNWWRHTWVCCFDSFPALYVYIIWEACNRAIFKNQWTLVSLLLVQKAQELKTLPK